MILEDLGVRRHQKAKNSATNLVRRDRNWMQSDAMPHPLRRLLLLRSTPLPQFFPGGAAASATATTAYAPSASAPASPGHELPTLLLFFILTVGFLFFLLGFLLRDIFWCFFHRSILRKRCNGIDPAVLSSFPVVPYDVVRTWCGPDCVVCLVEFEADEAQPVWVRVLTVCGHVFHSECIDSWLELHVTCPICRSDLRGKPDGEVMKALSEAQELLQRRGKLGEMHGDEMMIKGDNSV
jgi:Ring finger domain